MNQIEIKELESFVAVAEELNFSKAARRIHLSQPPLTRHIQSLEEKLGVQLLKRNTRSVEITPHGAIFLEDVRLLLRQINRASDALRQASVGQYTRLKIGFMGALLENGMVHYLQQFRESHPHCQIRLHEMWTPNLIEAVKNNEIDGAFIGSAPKKLPRGVQMVYWERSFLRIAMCRKHPLASRSEIDLKDLAQESWVMIARKAAPTFYQKFIELCVQEGFRPRITHESESQHVILAMIAVEDGISMVPDTAAQRSFPDVVFRPLSGPKVALDYAFIFRKDRASEPLKEFVKSLS